VALAVIAAAISAWVATDILGGLPHQIDEVVYLLQARWLLDGTLAPAVSAIQDHLTVPFTYLAHGRWLGHYPPGWPAFLALGLAAGAPQLVTILFGISFVVLIFLVGREIDDDLTGLAAASVAVVSPLARLLSGSMFPHPACATLVLLALWLLLLARRLEGWRYGAGAGLAMGCCLAVRPMTAVAVSLVLGGWLVVEAASSDSPRRMRTTLAAALTAGLAAAVPTLLCNAATTGAPFSLPYSLARGAMYDLANVAFGIRNLDAISISTPPGLFGWGWPLAAKGLLAALPLGMAVLPFLVRRARGGDWLLLLIVVVVGLGHLPTRANGLHGFGARYAFDVAGCLFLLTARGFRELARTASAATTARRSVAALFLVLNLTALVALPTRLGLYRGYYGITGGLQRQLAATGLERAVILVAPDDWRPWAEGARLITGPRRHEIVLAADLGDNSALETAFPGWPVLSWDGRHLRPEDGGGG
jgi:4-amino-4-deoxy-L-arabinose transferase-like glycosyltransferase